MDSTFGTVTIVGVGLLGGSLGMALRERGLADLVYGVGHREATLKTALERGAIDRASTELRQAAVASDLIVICTPAAAVPEYLDRLRPLCGKNTVVTDVASTKSQIARHVRRAWADPLRFVGSHPMAGSEKWGPEHATPALYEGAVTFVEERTDHAEDAHATVVRLWESVGSRVVQMNPGEHDTIVARTSHVPHIVASALINSLIGDPERIKPFLGAGFRDTTRIADGRPEIWRDICLTNPEAVYTGLMELSERLRFVANSTRDLKGAELERFFADAVEKRKRIQ